MTMPLNLILVRHGQSEANIIQKTDPDKRTLTSEELMTYPDRNWRLTEKGKKQAAAIGAWLVENAPINQKLFVSPYLRTVETAMLLGLDTSVHKWTFKRVLRERSWGEIDSIPLAEFQEQYVKNYAYKQRDPLYWTPPAGESIASVAENRVQEMFSELHREYFNRSVLMVTHQDFILAARLKLEHMTDQEFTDGLNEDTLFIKNCTALEYTRVDPKTGFTASKINWFRVAVPIEQKDGTFKIKVSQWQIVNREQYSNEDLRAFL